jgi:serine/threonine protein kinase
VSDINGIAAAIAGARACEDLFGDLDGGADEKLRALSAAFARIAKRVHPDLNPRDARAAHDAFVRASELRRAAEAKIRAGTYGDRSAPAVPSVLRTKRRAYELGALVARGDVCDLFDCSFELDGVREHGVLKAARSRADNDLLANEASTLKSLAAGGTRGEGFLRHLPHLHDSFSVEGRRANVLESLSSHASLERVLAAYPQGLDFRDAAWMVKRLLSAIGFLHRRGVVHAAIIPSHVLVEPRDHGASLVGFCHAVPIGERARLVSKVFRDFFAPELFEKKPATPQSDIFSAGKCALALLDADTPPPVRRFFETCVVRTPSRRPDDAWALHEELDALLRKLVGRPTFRPFVMPDS